MNQKISKLIALAALIALLAGLATAGMQLMAKLEEQNQRMEMLHQENEQLWDQMQSLQMQLERFMTVSSFSSWELSAAAWPDSTGADVTFTAVPSEYVSGMGVTLLVMLGDRQVDSVSCVWDGSVFSGTASLSAADGYSYYCLISGPSGVQQLTLMTPDSEEVGVAVYLQSSLSSYCNLVIHSWEDQKGTTLILTGAYAQVQLPRIHAQTLTMVSQELVLRVNGQVFAKVPIKLSPSEVEGSYEMLISDLHLPMPEMDRKDTAELYLEILLSDGRHLQGFGISWTLENGQLTASVG